MNEDDFTTDKTYIAYNPYGYNDDDNTFIYIGLGLLALYFFLSK